MQITISIPQFVYDGIRNLTETNIIKTNEKALYNAIYHGKPLSKGKWNGINADNPDWQRDDGSPIFLTCSECCGTVFNNGSANWNFCPNCGADMRKEKEDEKTIP